MTCTTNSAEALAVVASSAVSGSRRASRSITAGESIGTSTIITSGRLAAAFSPASVALSYSPTTATDGTAPSI
jgi:hypothetical protein